MPQITGPSGHFLTACLPSFRMKRTLLLALLALLPTIHAASFTEIVAFGDSLTDMGNRSVKRDETTSKFRTTWVTILAGPAMLNIPNFKPAGASFYYGGTNYAVGGASTEFTADLASERNRGQHLTQQISKRYLNPKFNTDGVKKDALHIIRIGTNDLLQATASASQILLGWSRLDKVGIGAAKSTEKEIAALAAAGVKHVLWGNLSDSGQLPSVVARAGSMGGSKALAALTKATFAYNREMDAAIARLEKAHPQLKIIKLDLNARFEELARDPAKFGLVDVTTGGNDHRHLFSSDGLHPSARGHALLAEYAFAILSATHSPATSPSVTSEKN